MLSLHASFLLFPPQNNLSTSGFLFLFTCLLSHFHLSLLGHSAIHLEEENTANAISLYSLLSALVSFHISAESDLFVCVVFLPVPVDKACYLCASAPVCERIRTSQEQPGEKDVLVHF